MKKYLSPKAAYIDYLVGDLPENPLDKRGRLLEAYDGNDYDNPVFGSFDEEETDEEDDFVDLDDSEQLLIAEEDHEEDEEEDTTKYLDQVLWDDGDGWTINDEMEWIDE